MQTLRTRNLTLSAGLFLSSMKLHSVDEFMKVGAAYLVLALGLLQLSKFLLGQEREAGRPHFGLFPYFSLHLEDLTLILELEAKKLN